MSDETMNDTLGESLSAFLDGELPRAEYTLLLARIQRDPRLNAALGRYSAMGECLRGEAVTLSRGFTARVCRAVAAEAAGQAAPSVAQLARKRTLRRAGQLAGGLALAATVAGAAILLLQREQLPAPGEHVADTRQGGETIVGGGPSGDEGLSYTVPAPAETAPMVPGGARLTDYVFAHSEYSTLMGRRNVLSSVIGEDPTPVEANEQGLKQENGKQRNGRQQDATPGDPR